MVKLVDEELLALLPGLELHLGPGDRLTNLANLLKFSLRCCDFTAAMQSCSVLDKARHLLVDLAGKDEAETQARSEQHQVDGGCHRDRPDHSTG